MARKRKVGTRDSKRDKAHVARRREKINHRGGKPPEPVPQFQKP